MFTVNVSLKYSGEGAAGFIEAVEPPYTYRGPYDEQHPDVAGAYANLLDGAVDALGARGFSPAMLLVDSIYDAKAILTPPPEYLRLMAQKIRTRAFRSFTEKIHLLG